MKFGKKKTKDIPIENKPLFLDDLVNLQKYAIASWSYEKISEYEPISYIFGKPSGHGGSEIMKVFKSIFETPKVLWKQELTTIDIFRDVYYVYQKEDKRLLYIEDMNRILSKSKTTVNQLFTVFLLMIQKDGLTDVVTEGGRKAQLNPPLNMSLVCSLTNDVLDQNYCYWYRMGLIDRLLIPTWHLTKEQEDTIKSYINYSFKQPKNNYKPQILDYGSNIKVKVNTEFLEPLDREANNITWDYFNYYEYLRHKFRDKYLSKEEKEQKGKDEKRINWEQKSKFKPTRLRKYKKLILLTIGKVISEHRKEVTEKDIDCICELSKKYFNMNYNPINSCFTDNSTYER